MKTQTVLDGSTDISYRWTVVHDPRRAQFDLFMWRYEVTGKGPTKKWYLDSDARWVEVAEGCSSEPTLSLPDILVHELGHHGPLNKFDGNLLEDRLIEFCGRILLGMTDKIKKEGENENS